LAQGIDRLQADCTVEAGGQGKSFRSHELLCASLAACMDMTTRMVLEKLQLAYRGVQVKVDLDRQMAKRNFSITSILRVDLAKKRNHV
jgi:putative redox protein